MKITLEISSFDDARSAISLLTRYLRLERPGSLTPISSLELTEPTTAVLQSAKILTVEALVEKSEDDLLRAENFGRKAVNEIKEALLDLQLRLRSSHPDL